MVYIRTATICQYDYPKAPSIGVGPTVRTQGQLMAGFHGEKDFQKPRLGPVSLREDTPVEVLGIQSSRPRCHLPGADAGQRGVYEGSKGLGPRWAWLLQMLRKVPQLPCFDNTKIHSRLAKIMYMSKR